jgi:sugar phosphate permease
MAVAIAGPLAAGAVCAGGLANTTVVSRWFRRRRGRALGIATVSSGAGGFVMVQLIGRLIERSGWRDGLFWTGALLAVAITTLALLVVRSRPDQATLERAGELDEDASRAVGPASGPAAGRVPSSGPPARDPRSADEPIWTLRALVATRNIRCIALGAGLLMASDGALLVSKVPYLLEIGLDLPHASFLVGCMTASSVAGKLGIGLAADRVDLRRLFGAVAACHVCLLLVLIERPGYATLLVAVSLFGVGIGGVYPMLATLTASAFGSASFGSVSGAMQLVLHPISIALLTFIGATHDRTGSYRLAFQAFIGLVFVATALVFLIELPARRTHGASEVSP